MATSLAAQLSVIAANSEISLNLKAQKARHSRSLIFEPRTAASQSFETLYILCYEGFQELCLLDGRFLDFRKDIFSEQSQEKDRSQMTAAQNEVLDARLEAFLGLVGGKLRLAPAIKAVEWLVRRFRIHENNSSLALFTFLPYHTLPIFTTLLSILPKDISLDFKFLQPYIRSLSSPSRHAIVQAASNHISFASSLSTYILQICKMRCHYSALLSFWAGIMTEATASMLDKAGSGRNAVKLQNQQAVILRLLPIMNHCLALKNIPELHIGIYMLFSMFASKGQLDEKLLTAMMEEVAMGLSDETIFPGLVCLSLLAQHRGGKQLTKRLTKRLTNVNDLANILIEISKQRRVDKLANGLCLSLIERLKKNSDLNGLSLIERIIENRLLSESQVIVIIKSLILVAYRLDEVHIQARSLLAKILVTLTEIPGDTGSTVRRAFVETEVDIDELELKLHTTFRPQLIADAPLESEAEPLQDVPTTSTPNLTTLLEQLPKKIDNKISFLSHEISRVYSELCVAFLVCTSDNESLKIFDEIPILCKNTALESPTYLSFFMRTWCSPYPVSARVAALQMVTRYLSTDISEVDFQAIIPYAIAALSDPSAKVRRGAGELLLALNQLYPPGAELNKRYKKFQVWAINDIHGLGDKNKPEWMSTEVAARLLAEIIVPALEECVLDKKHIESVFQMSLNSPSGLDTSNRHHAGILTQSCRMAILKFVASQIFSSPLYIVKLRLLTCANQVRSVGSSSRTRLMLPALKSWSSLNESQVVDLCAKEYLDLSILEDQFLKVITAKDEEGIRFLHMFIQGQVGDGRPSLVNAIFVRLKELWPSLKENLRLDTADILLAASELRGNSEKSLIFEGAVDLLQEISLSTDILSRFLDELPTAARLTDTPPATKRRRTSNGEVSRTPAQDPASLPAVIQKITLVLKLVDNSEPGKHPGLLKALFNVLAELQQFKAIVTSELAYLQGLTLGSLLAILKTYRADRSLKIDPSAVRSDLLVECVQNTTSPQVQNAALLLISSLAYTAPQLVFHSVMPIFTFMGSSTLQQNDEYSAHVINQTIREVIPPLIASLRKEKIDPVIGGAELLLSFVAAYEHVPPHRRKGLFISLVRTLGPEDFLVAIIAMLVDRYSYSDNIKSFVTEIYGNFSVEVQLHTALKYIEFVADILSPNSNYLNVLLNTVEERNTTPHHVALLELSTLPQLLSQNKLIAQTGELLARDDMDAVRVRELYSILVEQTLALVDSLKEHNPLQGVCGDVVESILELLSTCEFLKSIEGLLDNPDESLRRKILRSLEVRLDKERSSDASSRVAMLGFLPQLIEIIRDTHDIRYKQIAVACVDKISRRYGKKDPEAVVAAADTIAGSYCLGQTDNSLRVMALLCLKSFIDILKEGIIPVLPVAIPRTLQYMEESLQMGVDAQRLQSACYAFFGSLAQHLPYLITGVYLERIFQISNDSSKAELDSESEKSRIQCLSLVAKQVDAKIAFSSLERSWHHALTSGPQALREYLLVLGIAIDQHSKVVITKNSPILEKIFQSALDLRRETKKMDECRFTKDLIVEIESRVNEVALKMIYKLNDATFRPIFMNLVGWAATGLPKKDISGRILRQLGFYGFLAVFFENLKSIVTNYAVYFVENAVEILNSVNPKDNSSKELWLQVLRTLTKCFEHDQDDFWQSPSHFDAVAPVLCAQFTSASGLPVIQELVPSIVQLASAADSSDHHKELNMCILKHTRCESSSVRLAAVKCEQELTDKLGEEWLSMLPEMLPFISELQEDDDEVVEKETHRWIVKIEQVLGESLDSMLQ